MFEKDTTTMFHGVHDLMDYSQEELMELFLTLPAPTMEEMQGEFHSTKLSHHSVRDYLGWRMSCDNPLTNAEWVGKAFRLENENEGRGYNLFRNIRGQLYIRYPMYTCIAPSRYDAKPAFTLVYKAFYTLTAATQMVDECRKVSDGVYLLIGTYGIRKKDKMRPHFWLLEGPYRTYRGDAKAMPRKFNKKKEMPNYKD